MRVLYNCMFFDRLLGSICYLFLFFSDLRKHARQLENEIDLKLVSFGKLGTGFGSNREFNNASSR